MASPGNIRFDHLQVPDGYDWTIEDLNYSQFVPLAYQLSTPILAEPSMASAGPLRYTHPIQYPIASVAPGFPVSTSLHSTCSDLCRFKQNVIHQSPINNDCAAMAPAPGYLDPNHGVACTTLPVSTWSPQKGSQVKATSDSYTKGKRAYGRSRGRQQKQEKIQRSFECHWKDCTYRDPFCGKPALMRHIETQHISPRSFDCPSCEMSFNRKDNMTEHRGKVHWERV